MQRISTHNRSDFAVLYSTANWESINQRVLRDKEQKLREKEAELEKKRRLPIPERMELSALRKMKTIVEKIASYLPDGWVRDALLLALEGRDLIEEKNRQRAQHETLVMSFDILLIKVYVIVTSDKTSRASTAPCLRESSL